MVMNESHDDRGQAFTLEALVAGLLIVGALLFAMQAVVVTPGAPGADIEPEIRQQTVDLLDIAEEEGSLSEMVRYFDNDSSQTFSGAANPTVGYGSALPDTRFGTLINETFHQRGKVVNVIVEVPRADEVGSSTHRLIYRGSPPSASTVASTTITLYSNQTLTGPNGEDTTLETAAEEGTFPISNVDPDGPLHNVVHVRVIVW